MTLAIDFGTSNTVVTRWNAATQQPEVLSLGDLSWQPGDQPPLVPSLIYVDDAATAAVTVGQSVRDRGHIVDDARYFQQFKRGIGSTVQGFMPTLDGHPLSFETLGQWFLTALLSQAKQQDPDLNDLVFTVPVDSFETYRKWLTGVCQSLSVNQVRLLDEPTAAALGYGLRGNETVLVVDFGGGTLDLSLVQLTASPTRQPLGFVLKWGKTPLQSSAQRVQTAQVLAKAGEALGGADIDNWLAAHFAQHQALPITPLTLRLIERLKIRLSSSPSAQESYFDDETLESYDLALTRQGFEALLQEQGLFQRLDARLDQVLQQARRQGLSPGNIDAVLLVGGSAQIPAIQAWLCEQFEPSKVKLERPFTAVAEGALQLQRGLDLKDFLYHSYGIRYWDRRQNRHGWHAIIPSGQPYPMSDPVELMLGASVERQPSIELVIGELSDGDTRTEIFFDGGQLVTRQQPGEQMVKPLNDSDSARTVATLTPPGFPGSDRVRVDFRVDGQRRLRLTVDDLLTGETLIDDVAVVELS